MDNQNSKLLSISNDLSSDESRDVNFLCKDLVPKGASELKDIFMVLKKHSYTDQEITDFVAELLYYLKRFDLLKKHFKISKDEMEKKLRIPKVAKITPFRLLLYELGELVPDSEFMKIRSVFSEDIPNAKLDKATNMMDVFIELEKKSLLHNLEYLKNKSEHFVKDFKKKLLEYEQNNPVADEDQGEKTQLLSEDYSEASEEFYNMSSEVHGICLIINNFNFEKARQNSPECETMKNRTGTEKDKIVTRRGIQKTYFFSDNRLRESLSEVFSKLGFRVEVKNDLDGNEIFETVQSYSRKNYENNDCFICCIMSHGNKGFVYGTDGQCVPIKKLTSCFCRSSCRSLDGKPKLFFIQACQGSETQKCVPAESDACNASNDTNVTKGDLIPGEPDFLLGMATVLHCLAFRDPNEGSWYIQSLCKELLANYQRGEDILSILTKVNRQLSENCAPDRTQMPQPWTTLSKKLVFKNQPAHFVTN